MKRVLTAAAASWALALSACAMLGGEEGPAPGSPAAKTGPALPPPLAAPSSAPATAPAPLPEPEDLKPLPADQVKCIKPFVLRMIEKDGQSEAVCVAPSEVSGMPKDLRQ